ncbi:MAG: DNA repair exonuclease [Bacillota bacterium]|nr:DNA repair exonuclease [Bacillota bacterium]
MNTLTLLHFADLHLGSPLGNLPTKVAERVREEQKRFLRSLPDLCETHGAALLLIAGDVFDNPYPEQALADFFADCLAGLSGVDVYITPGNHDPLLPDSVWETTAWPAHVHIFSEKTQRFVHADKRVQIDGAAFTSYYADEPLFTLPQNAFEGFRILMWHGDLTASGSRYNPLDPKSPLLSSYDYLALGHVHNPPENQIGPAYPGFVIGRGFDETGAGGITRVQLSKNGVKTRLLPVGKTRFAIVEADISGAETDEEAMEKINEAIEASIGAAPDAGLPDTALRLYLTGGLSEEAVINTHILESRLLAGRPLQLQLKDRTRIAPDMAQLAEESGLRGIMAKNIQTRLQKGEDREIVLRAMDLLLRTERKEPLHYED